MKIELKPSMIAQYFEHECEKFLFFNAVDNETFKAIKGKKRPGGKETAASKAGDHWEDLIIDKIEKDPDAVLHPIIPLNDKKKIPDKNDYNNTLDC
ncbi:MAG: hypothetical protein VZR53_17325, partial [Prevotella sp.]|nr:hypothetical protein [Prevotella sp.]